MRMPGPDALNAAITWLRLNEGGDGEAEYCAAVADWIEHEERERMLRSVARETGVTVATLRRRLAAISNGT